MAGIRGSICVLLFIAALAMGQMNMASANSLEFNLNLNKAAETKTLAADAINLASSTKATPKLAKEKANPVKTTSKPVIAKSVTEILPKTAAISKVDTTAKMLPDAQEILSSSSHAILANVSEAKITSISFRSDDGTAALNTGDVDDDASSVDNNDDTAETVSFGIRSFTVEVASTASEKPIPLATISPDDKVAVHMHYSAVSSSSSSPSHQNDKVLNERAKVLSGDDTLAAAPILFANRHNGGNHKQGGDDVDSTIIAAIDMTGVSKNQKENAANNNNGDKMNGSDGNIWSGITIVPIKSIPTTVAAASTATPTAAITNNNEHELLSINSNGMHVEQKLENGLYRIKIAEIITDEFNNGLSDAVKHNIDVDDEQKINNTKNRFNNPSYKSDNGGGKINIADLYPSKLEDFSSIIRESNEKMIKEKNLFAGIGKSNEDDDDDENADGAKSHFNIIDDGNAQQNSIHSKNEGERIRQHESVAQQTRANGVLNSIETNIPTTKIEIELIDEPGTSKDVVKIIGSDDDDDDESDVAEIRAHDTADDKITDLTSKLQENDEVISTIERSFLKINTDTVDSNSNTVQRQTLSPNTINKPIDSMGFIERRVKKHDPTYRKRLLQNNENDNERPRSNIADVNLGGDSVADNFIAASMDNERKEKGDYSTTKFYNSKELYSELMNNTKTESRRNNEDATNSSRSQGAGKNNNKINENVRKSSIPQGINSPKQDAILSTTPSIASVANATAGPSGRKIFFINVNKNNNNQSNSNDKSNEEELERLQKDRKQIIKESKQVVESKANNLNEKKQPTKNMHLYIIHDDVNGRRSSESIKTNHNDNNEKLLSTAMAMAQTKAETKFSKRTQPSSIPAIATTASVAAPKTTSNRFASEIATTNNNVLISSTTTDAISSTESNLQQHLSSTARMTTDKMAEQPEAPGELDGKKATTTYSKPARPRTLSRLQEKINALECDMQTLLPPDSTVWRGNETHELNLPTTTPENCSTGADCMPMIISWEGAAEIQSGDVLIVEIDDTLLLPADMNLTTGKINDNNNINGHKATTTVYQVTRPGHEHCDATEGILLDITPLVVDGKKLVTLYDKDLTEGVNLLIVVSDLWGPQCVRLKVTVKSDNCGENAECSGKGVCFSNASMEGYECQCCTGFAGSHCEEIDACSPSPCTNNGICVDLSQGHDGNSYQCLCPYGYIGKNCQFESDPCQNGECQNGGTCTGNATHFRCECAAGYTGPLCQHNLNECESSPCVHGICVDQEDGFRCFCQPGFAGDLCNYEYNECESNPCLNNGQCIDHIGAFSCKCTQGYTGKRCHIKVDFCANNPCPEGHQCSDHGNDFSCDCPEGRSGPDCSQFPRTKCNVNPCANGGTCWTSEESFYCACRAGFTGKMCEDEFIVDTVVSSNEILSDDSTTTHAHPFGESSFSAVVSKGTTVGLHNAYIAVGTFAAAMFIVAMVVIVCHCKFHKSYRRFTARQHQLIPIFGFGRRPKQQSNNPRHWLSGKGHMPSVNKSASTTNLNQQNLNNNSSANSGSVNGLHNYHQQNSNHQPRNHFNRHLAMNLENDMYYTVDFSDSQHSPLIQ